MKKKRDWLPFQESRKKVHSLGLKSKIEYVSYSKSRRLPTDIPSDPDRVYRNNGWNGWEDFLGTTQQWLPFEEARDFVRSLGLKSGKEWDKYCKTGKKPVDIPAAVHIVYKKEWKGYGDWLGSGTIPTYERKYRPFNEAREFVRSLGLKSGKELDKYCKTGKKPVDIPAAVHLTYRNKGWNDWGDFLGTTRQWLPFEEAREFVRSLGLKSGKEWVEYCGSGKKPVDIPTAADTVYKDKGWNRWGDWLGTGYVANQDRQYRSFAEAKDFVLKLGLKSQHQWNVYRKSGKKPVDIPGDPPRVYKANGWNGWGDWLGTGIIASYNKVFRPFAEAREFVHNLRLRSQDEWEEYCKSGKRPIDIPIVPSVVYKKNWLDMPDWLGYEGAWSIEKVKELLKALIESRIIYDFSEVRLYDLLNSKGVLNISGNRHEQFFKNLIEISRTAAGKKAIEDYANSDSEEPPNLSSNNDGEGEIKIATSPEELAGFVKGGSDPLDYGKISSPEQILRQTDFLESICVDEEKLQFQVNCSIQEFWKNAFKDEINAVNTARLEGLNGNIFHDRVVEEFLSDYDAILKIRQALPKGYSFPSSPTLMQLYVAHKINANPHFGNFSGTGAGKTLSAILASRLIDSKMTVVVCPNDVVEQWKNRIMESFPDSHVITGKPAFNAERDESKHQYLVLNYDKFSQDYSNNAILNLIKQKIDFLVLDEIHFVKQRDDATESQRHDRVSALRTYIRDKNNYAKVLAMSATPVINNIMEGRSQLELMTAKEYADVATTATIPNAVTLHQKLALLSIREKRTYANVIIHDDIIVHAQVEGITPEIIRELKRNPLSIEKILTPARIPEIIKHIKGKTIIYTEYVTEIIEKLSKAVTDAGYSYALYIGEDHSGLKRFLNKDRDKTVQVLIASRPISVGIDGLQEICNRLIINTLPWTNAQFEQLMGRLNRIGQTKEVDVFVIKATLGGYPYDELIKWKRIQFKRSLADCAVDGTLPKRNLVTPQQAAKAAVEWLERLERGEISTVTRRDLDVELSPIEIERRVIQIGDFTKLNNQINKEKSETTFERMKKKPEEWIEYHRQFRERRKTWHLIPVEEIIKRIKELSPRWQIGDFGCGEAQIVQTFGKDRVHSFDFVAIDDKVTACDMRSVPLKDGEIDVAVFSLSLMEVNWPDHIMEATRSLAKNGYLFIVETTKSLSTRLFKLRNSLKEQGFEIYSDEERGDFTFIEARKR